MATPSLSVTGTAVAQKPGRNAQAIKNLMKPVVTAEQAWAMIDEKFSSRFNSVREAFVKIDSECDGVISDKEMRFALVALGLEMTNGEYKKLWRKFDTSGDGSISYAEFNNKVGHMIHPQGMLVMNRPDTPKVKEWQKRAIARGLKKKVKNLDAAFKEVDKDGSGMISHPEFIQLLRQLGLAKIGDEESWQMMQQAKKPGNDTSEMTQEEFKEAMLGYMRIPDELLQENDEEGPKPPDLKAAEKMLQDKLFNKFGQVQKAFRLFDEDKSGELTYEEFRRSLKTLNIVLNDDQFYALVVKFDSDLSGAITYQEFNAYLGPLLHPDSKDRSKAMAEVEEYAGMQDGFVFNPDHHVSKDYRKRGFERAEDEEIGDDIDERIHGKADQGHDSEGDDPKAGADSSAAASPELVQAGPSSRRASGAPQPLPGQAAGSARGSAAGSARGGSVGDVRRPSVASVRPASAAFARPVAARSHRAGSVATAELDLSVTEDKMRRVLGRSWVQVFSDVKRAAGPAGVVGTGIHLEAEHFRDVMAEKGVPLTSKEVRALSLRYGAGDGHLDAERMLRDTFKHGHAPTGARPSTAAPRVTMARGVMGAGRPPMAVTGTARPTSAFVRPSTAGAGASATMTMRGNATPSLHSTGKMIF